MSDKIRQVLVVLATPLIWVFSSLGFFVRSARTPSEFSDLSVNILVPQTTAFSIWFPIFILIMAYGCIQAFRVNRTRSIYRNSGWWMAAGLWGVALWGLATAFLPDQYVELVASLIFIPTVLCLVAAMVKLWQQRASLDKLEKWFVLTPVSLIAGWCSIAVFVGLNGVIWKMVEPLGANPLGTASLVLVLALCFAIYILRQKATNKIYAFPIIWGLSFLALRHLGQNGSIWIAGLACLGVVGVALASLLSTKPKQIAV